MSVFQVFISGRGANDAAEKLVSTCEAGRILSTSSHTEGTRDLGFEAIVEFFKAISPIASTTAAVVTTAYNIWKWRKDIDDKKEVKIKKKTGDNVKVLVVYPSTTLSTIEDFLTEEQRKEHDNHEDQN